MVTDPVKEIVTARPSKIGVCEVGVVPMDCGGRTPMPT
jgi:hypothetical protein